MAASARFEPLGAMRELLVSRRRRAFFIGLVVASSFGAWIRCASTPHVVAAQFSFDRVTFDLLPGHQQRLRGAITAQEIETIKAIAWRELTGTYAEFRIAFTGVPGPSFHVRVIQGDLTFGATGESRTLGGLG